MPHVDSTSKSERTTHKYAHNTDASCRYFRKRDVQPNQLRHSNRKRQVYIVDDELPPPGEACGCNLFYDSCGVCDGDVRFVLKCCCPHSCVYIVAVITRVNSVSILVVCAMVKAHTSTIVAFVEPMPSIIPTPVIQRRIRVVGK
jgi:hypothetical protein